MESLIKRETASYVLFTSEGEVKRIYKILLDRSDFREGAFVYLIPENIWYHYTKEGKGIKSEKVPSEYLLKLALILD